MNEPAFYECPSCGFFHPVGFKGNCTDEENHYDMDMLDERYPDGWQEVASPVAEGKSNLHRLEQLRPDIDVNGNSLEVGCTVRFYLSAYYRPDTDALGGIAITPTSGDAIDGTLEAIGEVTEQDPVPHYVIQCRSYDFIRIVKRGDLVEVVGRDRGNNPIPSVVRPYVNGQPINRCVIPNQRGQLVFTGDQTCPQFAVFRL